MRSPSLHLSPSAAAAVFIGCALVLLLVREFLTTNTVRAPPLQAVALLPPPPPPEPPPRLEEKQPQHEPLPLPDSREWAAAPGPPPAGADAAAPVTGPLGLDEAGAGGGDAFGLAGRPGGRELLLTSEGGGGNPNARFVQFADQLQSHIQRELNEHAELRRGCYTVSVYVRVGAAGTIEDVRIGKSTGVAALDSAIREAFQALAPMETTPPADMPWPVGLRVESHGAQCAPQAPAHAEPAPAVR